MQSDIMMSQFPEDQDHLFKPEKKEEPKQPEKI